MNKELQYAKRSIRAFIQKYWDDRRLAEIYAFNADGHMYYIDHCGCILGVTLADTLHKIRECTTAFLIGSGMEQVVNCEHHYIKAQRLPLARQAENGYAILSSWSGSFARTWHLDYADLGRKRLSAILRAEIRRRDRLAAVSPTGHLAQSEPVIQGIQGIPVAR